jgi:hypothetical protein
MADEKNKNIIVDKSAQREKLKEFIKSIVREMTGTSAVGGGAGPVQTPHAFGKAKNPTIGTDFKVVGEKKESDAKAPEAKPADAKPADAKAPKYTPITAKKPDDLALVKKALSVATAKITDIEKRKKNPAPNPTANPPAR